MSDLNARLKQAESDEAQKVATAKQQKAQQEVKEQEAASQRWKIACQIYNEAVRPTFKQLEEIFRGNSPMIARIPSSTLVSAASIYSMAAALPA